MSKPDEMGLTPEAALGYEQLFVPAIFHQWPPKITAIAEIGQGDNVLDVGCGTGVLTREVRKRVGEAGSVAGFDLSESMLSVAREHCPGVIFQQGTVDALPYDDASFDVVVSSFMLMFVPDPEKAAREIRRVLRPGGRLVVSVWQGLDNNTVYAALVDAARDVIDEASADSIAWPFLMGEAGKLVGILKAAGFENAAAEAHDGTAAFPSLEEFVKTEIQAWLLADSVDTIAINQLVERLYMTCPEFNEASGAIEFPLNALVVRAEAG